MMMMVMLTTTMMMVITMMATSMKTTKTAKSLQIFPRELQQFAYGNMSY